MAVTAQEIAAALGVSIQALQGALNYAALSGQRARINAELELLQRQRLEAIASFDNLINAKSIELAQADEALRQGVAAPDN